VKPPPLRHRPVPEILTELGLDEDDPRCRLDGWPLRVHADPWAGTSLRCSRHRCRHAAWAWPEQLVEDLRGIGVHVARSRRASRSTGALARVLGDA